METTPDATGNYEIALSNAEKGYVSIPCHPGTKVPCVKWKEWQDKMPSPAVLAGWFKGTRNNVAIITTGLLIFDCEEPGQAELVLKECGDTPHKLRTPGGGIHLGYRKRKGVQVANRVKIRGLPIDIRTDGGIEMLPNSATEKGRYEWLGPGLLPLSELPYGNVGWTRTRVRRVLRRVEVMDDADVLVRRARAYLARVEGARSGCGGHNVTMRVAGILIQKFGLAIEQAWPLFVEWNRKCEPEWSEKELLHKLQDAHRLRHLYARRDR